MNPNKTKIISISIGILILFYVFKNFDFENVFRELSKANLNLILLGLVFLFLGLIVKTIRWRYLLENRVPTNTVLQIILIGYFVNNILPARLGEIAKIYLMERKTKIGIAKTIGTIFVEKVFDIALLLIILIANILHFYSKGVDFKLLFGGFILPSSLKEKLNNFISAFKLLKNKRNFLAVASLTILIWTLEALWNLTILSSLNIKIGLLGAFFIAAFVNLSFSIPSLPGYFGIFHLMATIALTTWGVEKNQAFAYAFLQHSIEYIILTLLGMLAAFNLSFNPFGKNKWQKI